MRRIQVYTKALKEEPSKDGDYHDTYPPGNYPPTRYKLCVIITRVLTVDYDFCGDSDRVRRLDIRRQCTHN